MPTISEIIEELKKSGVNSKQTAIEMLEEMQKEQSNPDEFEKWLEELELHYENESNKAKELGDKRLADNYYNLKLAYQNVLIKLFELQNGKIVLALDKEEAETICKDLEDVGEYLKKQGNQIGNGKDKKCFLSILKQALEAKE
jgi:hypothetical protein